MRIDLADKFLAPSFSWSANDWRIPLALALGVHVLGLLLLIVSPYLHSSAPILNVQTVELFTASEIRPTPVPRIIRPRVPPPTPRRRKIAPAPISTVPKPKAASKPPISLRPLKSNTKSADIERSVQQAILERKLRQVRARVEEERAQKAVQKDVDTALERIRQSYAASSLKTPPVPAATSDRTASQAALPGPTGSGSAEVSEAKKRYYAAIQMELSRYWNLPESHDWKESLEVIAVLWFRRDGTVIKRVYEKESQNDYFNRFVRLTLEKVDKVPPIPPDLPKQEAEQIMHDGLGFRFHPSGIY